MVALTNEHAGSDGDIFSHSFKLMGLGPLIGKRTWGGVIGINPHHKLVDGTITTQPEAAFWFKDVGWNVENYGTDPDIEIDVSNAFLRRLVRTARVPAAVSGPRVADIGELQASPLRQLAAARPGELPGQHDFLARQIGADDMRAQFARTAFIAADHLLLGKNGISEEGVGFAGHGLHAQ